MTEDFTTFAHRKIKELERRVAELEGAAQRRRNIGGLGVGRNRQNIGGPLSQEMVDEWRRKLNGNTDE